MQQETICVNHDSQHQDVNTPIYLSSANPYIDCEEIVYPRYYNTNNQVVIVEKLALLEKAESGLVFSSGMAAISTTLLSILKPKDHILLSNEIYGGTYNLVVREFNNFGIEYDFVDINSFQDLEKKIRTKTKAIYFESPSNPLLTVVDIKKIAKFAQDHKLISIIDNTFATPINQIPIELGIDIVLHSGTKYLAGHSDICFGAMLSSQKIKNKIYKSAINFGGSLNPLDSYIIERSLKTLAIRIKTHNKNAFKIAHFLDQHSQVSNVYYPGLKQHPRHEIASKQMNGNFGGMLSFEILDSKKVNTFLNGLSLIKPTVSLGGVETLICQPSKTSHIKMSKKERLEQGITDGLLRLSVGIENAKDLIKELDLALANASYTQIT